VVPESPIRDFAVLCVRFVALSGGCVALYVGFVALHGGSVVVLVRGSVVCRVSNTKGTGSAQGGDPAVVSS
jgi:hypothetical protein